ncbi:MAG: hypothetical protein KF729_03035 [Sandaracinaceae bacterium]|nr:hypothetical protein [Sandaracinaceae bacterium]
MTRPGSWLLVVALAFSCSPPVATPEQEREPEPTEGIHPEPTEPAPTDDAPTDPSPDQAPDEPPPNSVAAPPDSAARPRSRRDPNRACRADADCVPAPSCCPPPCSAHVVNREAAARIASELERTCTPEARAGCISAGGCRTHAYLCVDGWCDLVYHDSPRYRARQP